MYESYSQSNLGHFKDTAYIPVLLWYTEVNRGTLFDAPFRIINSVVVCTLCRYFANKYTYMDGNWGAIVQVYEETTMQ